MPAPLASRVVCVWNRNISNLGEFSLRASRDGRHDMNPLSAADALLTVAIMSVAFLIEIALFILMGMI
jgi:hypothetical protein